MKTKLLEISIDDSYKRLLENHARFDFDFFVLTIGAATICFLGFVLNSPSIIIGSMVLSPLLYVLVAITISMFRRDWAVFFRSCLLLLIGFLIVLTVSFIASLVLKVDTYQSEIVGRLIADVEIYFIIAFVSGAAGMFCFLWPKISEAIMGIAISVALLPPLILVGIFLFGLDMLLLKALSIVLINTFGIILGALFVLFFVEIGQKYFGKKY